MWSCPGVHACMWSCPGVHACMILPPQGCGLLDRNQCSLAAWRFSFEHFYLVRKQCGWSLCAACLAPSCAMLVPCLHLHLLSPLTPHLMISPSCTPPCLCRCSLCNPSQLQDFLQLWPVGPAAAGPAGEVAMLQASANYFAVEPILRALQGGCRMGALARYVLRAPGPAGGQRVPGIRLPAYLQPGGVQEVRFDLWTPLCSSDRVAGLPAEERGRCVGEQGKVCSAARFCARVPTSDRALKFTAQTECC